MLLTRFAPPRKLMGYLGLVPFGALQWRAHDAGAACLTCECFFQGFPWRHSQRNHASHKRTAAIPECADRLGSSSIARRNSGMWIASSSMSGGNTHLILIDAEQSGKANPLDRQFVDVLAEQWGFIQEVAKLNN